MTIPNQLLFPLILRLEGAANIRVPPSIVQGLASNGLQPDQINRLIWQYKMWKFLATSSDARCCISCGAHIRIVQKPDTKTCSPRCHKIYKRHPQTPFMQIKREAEDRVSLVEQMATSDNEIDLSAYPWHQVLDGWTYVLHD